MANPVSLTDLRWEHRLIVVFYDTDNTKSQELRRWVEANTCNLTDRETLVIALSSSQAVTLNNKSIQLDETSVAALTQQRKTAADTIEMLLIGKDGGIKERGTALHELDGFLSSIDRMPMRKNEASRSSGDC